LRGVVDKQELGDASRFRRDREDGRAATAAAGQGRFAGSIENERFLRLGLKKSPRLRKYERVDSSGARGRNADVAIHRLGMRGSRDLV
jgi:hypothetical protein